MTGKFQYCEGSNIFVKRGDTFSSRISGFRDREPYYPIVAGYSLTIRKVKGKILPHVTLIFDCHFLNPAITYVVLSRVPSLDM